MLERLPAGKTVRLDVDGVIGVWEKMRDRPAGDPTPGLKPVGPVAAHWRRLFEKRRGALVDIKVVITAGEMIERTEAERRAAIDAFLDLAGRGWRSDQPYGARDELHER